MNVLTAPVELGLHLFQQAVLIPLRPLLRQVVLEDASRYLVDIEWRYTQARDLLNEAKGITGSGRKLTAEDLDTTQHLLTGYVTTNNTSNTGTVLAGSIRWQALHIVYAGVDWVIADGASSLTYHTFVRPGTGTTATLVSSNTKPVLDVDDLLVFVNNAGVVVHGTSSMPAAVSDGAVDSGGIRAQAVGTGQLATAVTTSITTAQTRGDLGVTNAATAQTKADTAFTNAGTAQTRGDLGVANAGIAQTKADSAFTNAGTAQTQANLGVTNAATALTRGDLGVANAATAQSQANLGVTNAATAQTQANLGVTNAATAQTQATLGVTNAATAQTQATLGVTNAATAQTAATGPVATSRLNILSHLLY